ncbi:MAG: hypothetical protein IJU44_02855 [Kiritimatiellae bacterium]|nr:hypothetical protein [Kiritimatiellia bacterium]
MNSKAPVYNLEITPLTRWLAVGFETALGLADSPAIPHTRCSELLTLAGVIALPVAVSVCVGGSAALWLICKILSAAINRMRRPKYYERERLRRRELRAQRRKIVPRSTLNPCPTPELLAELWKNRKRSEADMVRLGSALLDLDAYVDNRLQFDTEGKICGRNPGVKGWLFEHCPDIWAHYKTAMRYKQLAVKLRQAAGLADPYPAEVALGTEGVTEPEINVIMWRNEITNSGDASQENDIIRSCGGIDMERGRDAGKDMTMTKNFLRPCGGENFFQMDKGKESLSVKEQMSGKCLAPGWEFVHGAGPANNLPLARAVAKTVMGGGGGMSGLMARLNLRLDENFGLKEIGPAG